LAQIEKLIQWAKGTLYTYKTGIKFQLSIHVLNNLSINKLYSVCLFGVVIVLVVQVRFLSKTFKYSI